MNVNVLFPIYSLLVPTKLDRQTSPRIDLKVHDDATAGFDN